MNSSISVRIKPGRSSEATDTQAECMFLTGSDRIPIYGMSSLRIIIQSTSSGEQYLPVAHTCYNLLDLPKYSSKETLSVRLIQAIDHYEGFSLA
ncbi:putative E3 ubiquitin-protein ligase HERC3 [Platysternon megacephalum]|uniref:HECT-type E3 ubiquitin transferase n=1 Tax=Platysternon megacephalum TaxID=55544 RepID=A0A4D9DKX6_9SAUR|nr:putative E3 ubiquitin-protein ligase HERC3 [Platysternon megacephalum]